MAEKKAKNENEETPVDEAAEEPTVEAEGSTEAAEPVADEAPETVEESASEEAEEPAVEVAAEAVTAPEPEEAPAEEPAADESAEEPIAEASAEDEPAEAAESTEAEETEAAEPAPAPQSGPKPKKKRLPRALRPARTRKTLVKPAARKPIVRLEKPDHERGRRQERQGTVVSNAMDKTIVVKVDVLKAHPRYKKVVRRSTTFHAHDEANQANVGDVVRIVETRPLSKTKRWRLAEIVEAAK
jgi:small subunit ribosomal protein S17